MKSRIFLETYNMVLSDGSLVCSSQLDQTHSDINPDEEIEDAFNIWSIIITIELIDIHIYNNAQ
ncbi:MAG: hypothetical protein ACRD8W_01210 [Nitrososphaeraceae archaeon]